MASPPMLPRSTSDNSSKASSIKNPSSANAIMRAVAAPPEQQQQQQALKCPRCDSSNTKFCYYNNYSLSQPRHFCKTCRRYWTKGGALRNVPVGGGCRKSKKSKTGGVPPTLSLSSTSSSVSAAANSSCFQLGMLPSGVFNGNDQFFGFNYPIVAGAVSDDQMYGYGTVNHHHHSSSIALSIESLSSINQDLHWKLQQQRLAIMFEAGGGDDHNKIAAATATPLIEPISCQAAHQGDKAEICVPWSHDAATAAAAASASATAWFLEGRINGNNSNNNNSNSNRASDWNGITTWSDMPQFSALQ